jgi:hypothetical protein
MSKFLKLQVLNKSATFFIVPLLYDLTVIFFDDRSSQTVRKKLADWLLQVCANIVFYPYIHNFRHEVSQSPVCLYACI